MRTHRSATAAEVSSRLPVAVGLDAELASLQHATQALQIEVQRLRRLLRPESLTGLLLEDEAALRLGERAARHTERADHLHTAVRQARLTIQQRRAGA